MRRDTRNRIVLNRVTAWSGYGVELGLARTLGKQKKFRWLAPRREPAAPPANSPLPPLPRPPKLKQLLSKVSAIRFGWIGARMPLEAAGYSVQFWAKMPCNHRSSGAPCSTLQDPQMASGLPPVLLSTCTFRTTSLMRSPRAATSTGGSNTG